MVICSGWGNPHDDDVWIGGAAALGRLDELGIDAVVSLRRLGTDDVTGPADGDHATFWIVDSANTKENAWPGFVLRHAAAAVALFRAEGKKVLVHCVQAESRTPAVAALYGAGVAGISPLEALRKIREVLPSARPNEVFMQVLRAGDGRS